MCCSLGNICIFMATKAFSQRSNFLIVYPNAISQYISQAMEKIPPLYPLLCLRSVSGHLLFVGSFLPILPTSENELNVYTTYQAQCPCEHRENLRVDKIGTLFFILCNLCAGHSFILESHCPIWIKRGRREIIFIELLLCGLILHNGITRWALLSPFYTEGNSFRGFRELAHEATMGKW